MLTQLMDFYKGPRPVLTATYYSGHILSVLPQTAGIPARFTPMTKEQIYEREFFTER